MVFKGGSLPCVLRARNELSVAFADETLESEEVRRRKGVIPNVEFDVSKECDFPPDLLDYMDLKFEQVDGPVDVAIRSIRKAQASRLENCLRNEVARGNKIDQPRYSLVGCSYVHGLSEAEWRIMIHSFGYRWIALKDQSGMELLVTVDK